MRNDGQGHLSAFPVPGPDLGSKAFSPSGVDPWHPEAVAADFNNDGITDLAKLTSPGYQSSVSILRGLANGGFVPSGAVIGDGSYARWLQAGDLNGDGAIDLVYSGGFSRGVGAHVYLGRGDGTFGAESIFDAGGNDIENARLVDVNNDGRLDLLAILQDTNGHFSGYGVLFGDGVGHLIFNANTLFHPTDVAFNVYSSLDVGDFDGDSKSDFIFNNNQLDTILAHGNGDGTFQVTATSPANPASLYYGGHLIADFDGDGSGPRPGPWERDASFERWRGPFHGRRPEPVGLSQLLPRRRRLRRRRPPGRHRAPALCIISTKGGLTSHSSRVTARAG